MRRTLPVKPRGRLALRALRIFSKPLAHVREFRRSLEQLPPRSPFLQRECAVDAEQSRHSDIPEVVATAGLNSSAAPLQTSEHSPEQLPSRSCLLDRRSGSDDGDPYQPSEALEPTAATDLNLSHSPPGVTGDTSLTYRDDLLDAVKNERLELVERLHIAGAGLSGYGPRTEAHKIPLLVAARAGSEKSLTKLLDIGADINIRDIEGRSAAFWTAFDGQAKCLQILARRGMDLNKPEIGGNSPLHVAARNGHPDCGQTLCTNRANCQSTNTLGRMPLHEAVEQSRVDSVRILTASGAHVNSADSLGETPLHKAARTGHEKIVHRLLLYKAAPDKADRYGETPTHIAAYCGHKQVLKMLVDARCSVNVSDLKGRTPLYNAVGRAHLDIVGILMDKNADTSLRTDVGHTALDFARYLLRTSPPDSQRPHLKAIVNLLDVRDIVQIVNHRKVRVRNEGRTAQQEATHCASMSSGLVGATQL